MKMGKHTSVSGIAQRDYTGSLMPLMNFAPEDTTAKRINALISKTLESQVKSSGEFKQASISHNKNKKNNFSMIRYSENLEDTELNRNGVINSFIEWGQKIPLMNSLPTKPIRTNKGLIVFDDTLCESIYGSEKNNFYKNLNTTELGECTSFCYQKKLQRIIII